MFGAIVLLAVVFVATHLSEGGRLWDLLRRVRPLPICLALLLQSGTYLCVALVLQKALLCGGESRSFVRLFPLALAKQFVAQAVPSIGLSGNLMLIRGLENRRVPRPLAVRAVLVSLLSYYLAFTVSLMATIVIIWLLSDLTPVILTALTLLLVLLAATSGTVVWLGGRRAAVLHPRILRWLMAHELDDVLKSEETSAWNVRLLTESTLISLAIFVLDASTLGVLLRAVGADAAPAIVFASLVAATAVASVALVPGGLGTFEGTCVALLHAHGVELESALAGTLLLRGFTFWLPMVPGLLLSRREVGFRGTC
jgi:uncharacterized protein (TIRG00374 family)